MRMTLFWKSNNKNRKHTVTASLPSQNPVLYDDMTIVTVLSIFLLCHFHNDLGGVFLG